MGAVCWQENLDTELISIVTRTVCLLAGFPVGCETVKDWHAGSGRWEKIPNVRVEYFSFFLFIGKNVERNKCQPPSLATWVTLALLLLGDRGFCR